MIRVRGFTLIELLVAMAIVAVIGVMALGGLNTVIQQQTIAEEIVRAQSHLQQFRHSPVRDAARHRAST